MKTPKSPPAGGAAAVAAGRRCSRCGAGAVRLAVLLAWAIGCSPLRLAAVDFKAELFGEPSRIFLSIEEQDLDTGYVRINGAGMNMASQPEWDFGDGTVISSWFPAEHTYAAPRANYIVTVTADFTDGTNETAEVLVRFGPPQITPVALSPEIEVTIPGSDVPLVSRMPGYGFSPTLTHFDDSFFTASLPREAVEYILTVAANVQREMVNHNVFLVDGGFRQYVLRQPGYAGMYSIWYSSPVAFGAGDWGFQGTPAYSSLFHEMGHNTTLNFPANYYYGGKIDGSANAIYSETMAQIFQHATAYEILNHGADYGLPDDILFEIHRSASSTISGARIGYEQYLSSGANFQSWNDPATLEDETIYTFITIAYKFFAHAENGDQGYVIPVRRLMRLMEVFNEDLRQQYAQHANTPAAAEFRSTLWVAGLSHAFQSDLRAEFRTIGFPVSDSIYDQLISLATSGAPSLTVSRDGGTVVVSWPWPADGWVLESNDALSPAAWLQVPPPYQPSGPDLRFVEPSPTGRKFYRLRK